MHRSACCGAHKCLGVIGLERAESRRVALSSGLGLDSYSRDFSRKLYPGGQIGSVAISSGKVLRLNFGNCILLLRSCMHIPYSGKISLVQNFAKLHASPLEKNLIFTPSPR
jgi:hypothetical protein